MIWQEKSFDRQVVSLLEKSDEISPMTAKLLSTRSISSVLHAENFLKPKLANLRDPFEIPHMHHGLIELKVPFPAKNKFFWLETTMQMAFHQSV